MVALVLVSTVSACGAAGAGGRGTKAARPVITVRQAGAVVMALDHRRVQAMAKQDAGALASSETDPQLSVDQSDLQQARILGAPATGEAYVSVRPLVPKRTAFPAWFAAVGKTARGDTELDLVTRHSAAAPWQLAVETRLEGTVRWDESLQGSWVDAGDLHVDPSRTLAAYWNAATGARDGSGPKVAPGNMTSDVASEITREKASNEGNGWTVAAAFAPAGDFPEAIKVSGGGVLGFAGVTERLQAKPRNIPCFLQPGSNDSRWDPLVPNGNYQELDLTYTYLEGMVRLSTGALKAVSFSEATTGVDGTACPG